MENRKWALTLQNLIFLCDQRGIKVILGSNHENYALTRTDTIYLKNTSRKENMCYLLLHEVGHLLVCADKNYEKKFSAIVNAKTIKNYGTLSYRVGIIEEELAAWKAGYEFALRNCLDIDEVQFNKIKSRNLATYMKWATERQKWRKQPKKQQT